MSHKLHIGDRQYAAKKLINVGEGPNHSIDIDQSVRILQADLVRLKRMQHFTKLFMHKAMDQDVDVAGKRTNNAPSIFNSG